MDDLGAPSSYLVLEKGAACYSSDGQPLGKVEHVLADPDLDVFDGFVLDKSVLPGGHRFVDADQVASIYERGVVLSVDAAAAQSLPSRPRTRARSRWGPTTSSRTRRATSFIGRGTGSPGRSDRGRDGRPEHLPVV